MTRRQVRRALVSVYDKTGLVELGRALVDAGVELVSTGSTASTLRDAGLAVTAVSDVTGFPEILDGRVKTLHPRIHGGLLADQRNPDHRDALAEHDIAPFELVVANLYPFAETVASGAGEEEIVEQIDIGGPSMVRAAAKNHASVAVVVSPDGYAAAVEAVRAGGFTLEERKALALLAFRHTADYDLAVASWLGSVVAPDDDDSGFPQWMGLHVQRSALLRYGENPHQSAALYLAPGQQGLARAEQLHGKEMSYNNYIDTDAAIRAAYDHAGPCVAIIKHQNPCGIAVAGDIAAAHAAAHACDPTSAFGGVIAANRAVTLEMARQVDEVFTEVIVAPSFDDGVVELLARKPSIRILRLPAPPTRGFELRQIGGGLLTQTPDAVAEVGDDPGGWELATGDPVDDATLADLAFAWRAVRAVKSNAILLARGGASVGIGMGQVNRVDSCRLAVARAGDRVAGAVAASDAFFPWPDGPQVLFDAGIRAIVSPGGSMRDNLTIEAAQAVGASLYVTGVRHFAH